ncbi:hypothetical protein EWM64_g2354 [Hericium alpestre]|uniref:NADH:flavin oxidoreductase/NADH oxidase N-terminal domain-containing protein n=1 Tax=Hericium alpestre TaxID=135208 RepID=A0A4Z0A3Q5_9AGAM|nr:hypothetical protein EWM64_g2354 [Hericium alpestre]
MSSISAAAADTALFKPIRVGNITLSHRVALAPLTRCHNTAERVPTDLTLEHYVQRARIYNEEQVRAWRKIVDAVHARGSFIFLQLWALGRAGDPALLTSEGNYPYVAPSPINLSEESGHTPGGPTPPRTHRARNSRIHGANGYLVDQFLQDVSNVRDDEYDGSVEGRCRFALEVVKEITGRIGEKWTALRCSPFSDYQGEEVK